MPVRYWCNAGKHPVSNRAFVGAQLSAGGLQTNFQAAFRRRECNSLVEGLKELGADPKMWAAHQAHGDLSSPWCSWQHPSGASQPVNLSTLGFPRVHRTQNKPYNYSLYLLVLSNYHMNVWTLCTEWESWVLVCGHQNSYELSIPKGWFCFLPVIGFFFSLQFLQIFYYYYLHC